MTSVPWRRQHLVCAVSRSHSLLEDSSFKAMTCGDVLYAGFIRIYIFMFQQLLFSFIASSPNAAAWQGNLLIYLVALLQGPEVRAITPFSASVDSLGTTRVM